VALVLREADRLQLPEEIVVNGATCNCRQHNVADLVARDLVSRTISRWPGFDAYLDAMLEAIQAHFESVASRSNQPGGEDAEDAYDFPPFLLALFGEKGWLDSRHVCSTARARVLALKMEERGFICEFSETDLAVSLPLRLKGEAIGGGPGAPDEGPLEEEEEAGGEDRLGY